MCTVMGLKADLSSESDQRRCTPTPAQWLPHTPSPSVSLLLSRDLQADDSVGPVHLSSFVPNLWNFIENCV